MLRLRLHRYTGAVLALAVSVWSGLAQGTSKSWTSPGSAGTVDETDTAKINFTNSIAQLSPTAVAPVGAVIRYPVVPVDGLLERASSVFNYTLSVRYTDTDTSAAGKVLVSLRQYSLATGRTTTLLTFNSDYTGRQQTWTGSSCAAFQFDFLNNAYWLEATLTKSAAGADVAVRGLNLHPAGCPIP